MTTEGRAASDATSEAGAAFLLLRNVEVVLRELVITELNSLGDPKWWRKRIPADIQKTAKGGQEYERATKWLDASTYHPIYYTDFADVRKIITSNNNWQEVFRQVLYNKDQLTADLQSLEPIRNTIAHSRRLSSSGHGVLQGVHDKVRTSIGDRRWGRLMDEATVVHAAVEIPRIVSVLTEARQDLDACQPVALEGVTAASTQWWWDPDVLGGPLENADRALSLLSEYNSLPRGRGQGHILETWIQQYSVIQVLDAATSDLRAIIAWRR